MACKHERIKSVNCRIYCDICGVELPLEFLTEKHPSADEQPAKAAKTPAEAQETQVKKTSRKKVK